MTRTYLLSIIFGLAPIVIRKDRIGEVLFKQSLYVHCSYNVTKGKMSSLCNVIGRDFARIT